MTSDQMDLLVEQVKMLAGEIAFGTSNLKRLMDQSVNDPEGSKFQVCLSCPLLFMPHLLWKVQFHCVNELFETAALA